MRIGTWNLDRGWKPAHHEFLRAQKCDVWLLTEVNDKLRLDGWHEVRTSTRMKRGQAWAAIFSRLPLSSGFEPHPASIAARVDGVLFCCSILPWRGCDSDAPWLGERHADKTANALEQLISAMPAGELVWGGDWNHALAGTEYAGSLEGRRALQQAVSARGLRVPTETLPHRIVGLLSIDHVAIPSAWSATAQRVPADGLSDHDAYVVEVSER
jgi:hypothetical protein